ncbi:MAG: hypothetical protein IPL60_13525 [Ardenticatenia bacterium]|nr:hypothetical protein [Ardenticatenia bacterium]
MLVAIGPRIPMIDVSKPALPLDVGGWTMAADVKAMALASDDGYIFVAVGNQVRASTSATPISRMKLASSRCPLP